MNDALQEADKVRSREVERTNWRQIKKWSTPVTVEFDGRFYDRARKAAKAQHMTTKRWITRLVALAIIEAETPDFDPPIDD